MIKATILAVGASAAVFSAMLAAPAQAAPVRGGDHGPCENSTGNGGLLGLALLNFQQNNCDIDFVNEHMGRHHEHHWGDWD